jgi:hypothetical protein
MHKKRKVETLLIPNEKHSFKQVLLLAITYENVIQPSVLHGLTYQFFSGNQLDE